MFGIKKNVYYVLSIISLISSGVLALLAFLEVIKDEQIAYLSAIALFLLSVSFFITPASKKMKIVEKIINESREHVYKALENKAKDFRCVTLVENNGYLCFESKDGFYFENLNNEEALYLYKRLIKDYVIILYSVYENNKLNIKKAEIEEFSILIKYANQKEEEIKIVENYAILK